MNTLIDLTNKNFGYWTVLQKAKGYLKEARWACICRCGTRRTIKGNPLRKGLSKSCGCGPRKRTIDTVSNKIEYSCWKKMIARCYRPKEASYIWYGKKGIKVAPEWFNFRTFLSDIGPRPSLKYSLDRINSNGNYEPGNVRWATRTAQARNRRNNRLITVNGTTLTVSAWAEKLDISPNPIYSRLQRGWSPLKALRVDYIQCPKCAHNFIAHRS